MDQQLFKRSNEVFNEALELPPDERAAFLDRECGDDTALLRAVDKKLRAFEDGTSLPSNPLFPAVRQDAVPEHAAFEPGRVVGNDYLITRLIGKGGMGTVYAAKDQTPGFDLQVALKQAKPAFREIFEREIRILSGLNHPNLPQVHRLINEDEERILVMQYIEGETLEQLLERQGQRPFEVSRVVEWAHTLLDALDYLHTFEPPAGTVRPDGDEPILHRDLKPSNVMLTRRGHLYLLDFGIAKSGALHLTHQATAKGFATHAYASPEQLRGAETTVRSDLYSLGATLFHLLTGAAPLPADARHAVGGHDPDPLREVLAEQAEIPDDLAEWLTRSMALDPARRPVSAAAMLAELKQIHLSETSSSRRTHGIIAALLLLGLVLGYWLNMNPMSLPPEADGPAASADSSTAPTGSPRLQDKPVVSAAESPFIELPDGSQQLVPLERENGERENGPRETTGVNHLSAEELVREGPPPRADDAHAGGVRGLPVDQLQTEPERPHVSSVETKFTFSDGVTRGIFTVDGKQVRAPGRHLMPVGTHRVTGNRAGFVIENVVLTYQLDGEEITRHLPVDGDAVHLEVEPDMKGLHLDFSLMER